jgi:hypothetical protein
MLRFGTGCSGIRQHADALKTKNKLKINEEKN